MPIFSAAICLLLFSGLIYAQQAWYIPVNLPNRSNVNDITLTNIGKFGIIRKARPKVPAHYHTGMDICRPTDNYDDEPILPACKGIVISVRDDGPYAQIIIEHIPDSAGTLWTVYEHVAGIQCSVGDSVTPSQTIARFFNKKELQKYGWHFDHFHFEIIKQRPRKIDPPENLPQLHYRSYAITCYTKDQLQKRMINPMEFLKEKLSTP